MQALADKRIMEDRGITIPDKGVPTILDTARHYWVTSDISNIAKLANQARLDIYSQYLENLRSNQPLDRRSNKKLFNRLDNLDDLTLIGFREMSIAIRTPDQEHSSSYQQRIFRVIEELDDLEKYSPNNFFIGIAKAWAMHKEPETHPEKRNRYNEEITRHPDDISIIFTAAWLNGAFDDEKLGGLDSSKRTKALIKEIQKVSQLEYTSKAIALPLYDSINPELFSRTNQLLSKFLINPQKPVPAPMLGLICGLARNANTIKELDRAFVLALDIPKDLTTRLLIGLSINQVLPARLKQIKSNQWLDKIGDAMADSESILSLGKIRDVEDRHLIYQALLKATQLEDEYLVGKTGRTAQAFSDYIENEAKGSFSPLKKSVPEEKVKGIIKALSPILTMEASDHKSATNALSAASSNLANLFASTELGR